MNLLDKVNMVLNRMFMWLSGCFLGVMIILTCANIFLRLFGMPIRGTFELMGYFGAVVMALALGYTQIKKGHMAVDILVMKFPGRVQKALNGINSFICMIFFGIASWQVAKYAEILRETGEVTETLRIIYYPFTYGVALGCALLSLVFLTDFLKSFSREKEGEA